MVRAKKKMGSDDDEPGGEKCISKFKDKVLIGTIEPVLIGGNKILARIDTGAKRCGICDSLVDKLGLGPSIKKVEVNSASGNTVRDVIGVDFILADKKIRAMFTISDRRHMKYDVLIGRNALKRGFLIDPSK